MLAACGAVMPEVLVAAAALEEEGVPALVLDVTSPDRLYRGWRDGLRDAGARRAGSPPPTTTSPRCSPPPSDGCRSSRCTTRRAHHLAWLGAVFGAPVVPVGVDDFGQSGSIAELYGVHDLQPAQLVNAALVAVS